MYKWSVEVHWASTKVSRLALVLPYVNRWKLDFCFRDFRLTDCCHGNP